MLKNLLTDHQYNALVQSDKLRLLYHQSFPAVFLSVIAALIFSVIYWPQVDKQTLIVWIAAIFITSLIRLTLFLTYRRINPQGLAVLRWEKPYFYSLFLSSLVWGAGLILITYSEPMLYQVIAYFFLIGMAGSALSVYSAIRYFAISTIAIILWPITVWFFLQGETLTVMMAATTSIFLLSAHRATRILSNTLHRSFTLTHKLRNAKETAERLARTDTLTNINNRRAFTELASLQIQYCRRHQHPVSLLVLDADHFKRINDSYGHASGDLALQHLSRILKKTVRSSDICGRIGGEEFAILLSNSDLTAAASVAENLLRSIAKQPVKTPDHVFSITVSIGVASGDENLERLLINADNAMYQAKNAGRNQVVCYHLN